MPIFETGKKVLAVVRTDQRINAFIQGGTIASFDMPAAVASVAPHAFDNIQGLLEIVFPREDIAVPIGENSGIGASVRFFVQAAVAVAFLTAEPNRDVTGYLDYTDTIPTFSGYTAQWYANKYCTIPVSTGDFVSGTRYYVRLTAI